MTIVPDTGRKMATGGPPGRGGPRANVPAAAAAPSPAPARAASRQKDQEQAPPAKKKSKKKLILIVLVVVVLAAGFYFVKLRHHTVYKAGQTVPNGKVVTLGAVTANTADGRLVQVRIALQLSAVANSKQEATDAPQLTNAVITDLANFTYAQLLTNAARATLQSQLLSAFQKIMGTVDGAAQQVNAVYFTSFILQ